MIPKVDSKWFREKLTNAMDFMGLITKKDWLWKRNLFLSPSKEKRKEDATSQVNLCNKAEKKGINLKRISYQPYTSLVNCFKFLSRKFRRCKNLRQAGRRKKLIILKPRSSTCLLRSTKPVTLYMTRALITLKLIFLETIPNDRTIVK